MGVRWRAHSMCPWRTSARCGDSSSCLLVTMSTCQISPLLREPAKRGERGESDLGAAVRVWLLVMAWHKLHGWRDAFRASGGWHGQACRLLEARFAARSGWGWVACWHVSVPVQWACRNSSSSRSWSTTARCVSSSPSMRRTRMGSRGSARVRSRAAAAGWAARTRTAAAGWVARTTRAYAQQADCDAESLHACGEFFEGSGQRRLGLWGGCFVVGCGWVGGRRCGAAGGV